MRESRDEFPRDEPVRDAAEAAALVAFLLLVLRLTAGGTAGPGQVALVFALYGGGASFVLFSMVGVTTIVATITAPLLRMAAPAFGPLFGPFLRLYDVALHLGLVLSAMAGVAALALDGMPVGAVLWFALQCAFLLVCRRVRLQLFGDESTAGRG